MFGGLRESAGNRYVNREVGVPSTRKARTELDACVRAQSALACSPPVLAAGRSMRDPASQASPPALDITTTMPVASLESVSGGERTCCWCCPVEVTGRDSSRSSRMMSGGLRCAFALNLTDMVWDALRWSGGVKLALELRGYIADVRN